jgi:hypothetical protein
MTLKFIFLVLFITSAVGISLGQTANDFEKNYGSVKYYEIRPEISMLANFDKDGQVCSVTLMPNRISKTKQTRYVGNNYLNPFEVKEILNELVPPGSREGEGRSLGFIMTGGMGFSAYEWDNVRVNTTVSVAGSNFKRATDHPKSVTKINAEDFDSLFTSIGASPETVSITWLKRQCLEK